MMSTRFRRQSPVSEIAQAAAAPLLIGGRSAPTPVDGEDLGLGRLPELRLMQCDVVDGEVFLRYQVVPAEPTS